MRWPFRTRSRDSQIWPPPWRFPSRAPPKALGRKMEGAAAAAPAARVHRSKRPRAAADPARAFDAEAHFRSGGRGRNVSRTMVALAERLHAPPRYRLRVDVLAALRRP